MPGLPAIHLPGSVVVVTGAARGIGAGLARAFAAEGAAAVVVADLDGAEAAATAAAVGAAHPGTAVVGEQLDVADAAQVEALVDRTEAALGPVEVFVANAGVPGGGGLDADEDVWALAWDVNLMAHVRAARVVVPRMVARGHGSFVTTASAAGLLTNLGNAPYSVTKHAAVAFAEWLAVTYREQGLHVACLCPMGVDTRMLREGLDRLEGASVAAERVLPLDEAVALLVQGLHSGRLLVLTHPETATYEQHRVADRDRWVAGMQRVQRDVLAALAARQGVAVPGDGPEPAGPGSGRLGG